MTASCSGGIRHQKQLRHCHTVQTTSGALPTVGSSFWTSSVKYVWPDALLSTRSSYHGYNSVKTNRDVLVTLAMDGNKHC